MHDAGRLAFSYLADFGSTAHICEGAGVALPVGSDRYEYVDDSGVVEFVVVGRSVRVRPVRGAPQFCGAGWSGEGFEIGSYQPVTRCTIASGNARFRVVDHLDPEIRPARVGVGATVEVVEIQQSSEIPMVLVRHVGVGGSTVGLLLASDVSCQ